MVINLFTERPEAYGDLLDSLGRFDAGVNIISVDMVLDEVVDFTKEDLLIADPRALEICKSILDTYRMAAPGRSFIIAAPRYIQSALNEIERKWSFLPLRSICPDPLLEEEVYRAYLKEIGETGYQDDETLCRELWREDGETITVDPETGEVMEEEEETEPAAYGDDVAEHAASLSEKDLMHIIGELSGIIDIMAKGGKYGDVVVELSHELRRAVSDLELTVMLNEQVVSGDKSDDREDISDMTDMDGYASDECSVYCEDDRTSLYFDDSAECYDMKNDIYRRYAPDRLWEHRGLGLSA